MEPINYLTQVVDPFVQATQGLKLGSDITELQQKQALIVQQQQQQQLAAQEQARFFAKPNPTMRDALQFASVLPKDRADALRPYIENFSKEQQQGVLKANGQILSALQVKPETGIKLLRDYATAQRNSGDEAEASLYERIADAAADPERGPGMAFKSLVTVTARIPGAKEMFETIDKASTTAISEAKAPAELRKKLADASEAETKARVAFETATDDIAKAKALREYEEAKAAKEAVAAEFARPKAVLDVQQQAATLRKTDADILIAQENNRIAALNAAQAKETNALRRQELQQKIDDATKTRDAADRDQKATLASQVSDIDNFLNTATRVVNTPKDVIKSATGPITSRLPTLSAGVSDFESLVETLGSQAFITQIPKIKGVGALSEREGDKLQASLQNLSLKQSPERLVENVNEAVRLLTKARANITARSGLATIPFEVRLPNGQTATFPTQAAVDAFKKQAGIQ
jgi:cytochrome c1